MTKTPDTTRPASLTPDERRALWAVRRRYREDGDLFSTYERAQLRFVRWLYQSGQLEP